MSSLIRLQALWVKKVRATKTIQPTFKLAELLFICWQGIEQREKKQNYEKNMKNVIQSC